MKNTTNVFLEGLKKDLHPLATKQQTYTDALNATIITKNGNELLMLNDMGNTKIQDAKTGNVMGLREGFIPVGMKEYGGIMYIASVNKDGVGELGTIPSPVIRYNLSNKEIQDFSQIKDWRVLKGHTTSKLLLLTNNKLTAGEKFAIALDIQDNIITKSCNTLVDNSIIATPVLKSRSVEDSITYKFVDFKLPSGNLWSTSPISSNESTPLKYAFGEIESKKEFTKKNYSKITILGDSSKYGEWNEDGTQCILNDDSLRVLAPEDDAAFVNWGEDWSIPTIDDFKELLNRDNCKVDWYNNELRIYAKDDRSKSIRLTPDYFYTSSIAVFGKGVYSYSINPNSSCDVGTMIYYNRRMLGQLIRPIKKHSSTFDGHEFVDFNLPSGNLWAVQNIGQTADKTGDLFAWGEVTTKESYNWDNYKFNPINDTVISEFIAGDVLDNNNSLTPDNDAASQYFGDNKFKIPSKADWEELFKYAKSINTPISEIFKSTDGDLVFTSSDPLATSTIDESKENNIIVELTDKGNKYLNFDTQEPYKGLTIYPIRKVEETESNTFKSLDYPIISHVDTQNDLEDNRDLFVDLCLHSDTLWKKEACVPDYPWGIRWKLKVEKTDIDYRNNHKTCPVQDDPASKQLKGQYRLPTLKEFEELISYCDITEEEDKYIIKNKDRELVLSKDFYIVSDKYDSKSSYTIKIDLTNPDKYITSFIGFTEIGNIIAVFDPSIKGTTPPKTNKGLYKLNLYSKSIHNTYNLRDLTNNIYTYKFKDYRPKENNNWWFFNTEDNSEDTAEVLNFDTDEMLKSEQSEDRLTVKSFMTYPNIQDGNLYIGLEKEEIGTVLISPNIRNDQIIPITYSVISTEGIKYYICIPELWYKTDSAIHIDRFDVSIKKESDNKNIVISSGDEQKPTLSFSTSNDITINRYYDDGWFKLVKQQPFEYYSKLFIDLDGSDNKWNPDLFNFVKSNCLVYFEVDNLNEWYNLEIKGYDEHFEDVITTYTLRFNQFYYDVLDELSLTEITDSSEYCIQYWGERNNNYIEPWTDSKPKLVVSGDIKCELKADAINRSIPEKDELENVLQFKNGHVLDLNVKLTPLDKKQTYFNDKTYSYLYITDPNQNFSYLYSLLPENINTNPKKSLKIANFKSQYGSPRTMVGKVQCGNFRNHYYIYTNDPIFECVNFILKTQESDTGLKYTSDLLITGISTKHPNAIINYLTPEFNKFNPKEVLTDTIIYRYKSIPFRWKEYSRLYSETFFSLYKHILYSPNIWRFDQTDIKHAVNNWKSNPGNLNQYYSSIDHTFNIADIHAIGSCKYTSKSNYAIIPLFDYTGSFVKDNTYNSNVKYGYYKENSLISTPTNLITDVNYLYINPQDTADNTSYIISEFSRWDDSDIPASLDYPIYKINKGKVYDYNTSNINRNLPGKKCYYLNVNFVTSEATRLSIKDSSKKEPTFGKIDGYTPTPNIPTKVPTDIRGEFELTEKIIPNGQSILFVFKMENEKGELTEYCTFLGDQKGLASSTGSYPLQDRIFYFPKSASIKYIIANTDCYITSMGLYEIDTEMDFQPSKNLKNLIDIFNSDKAPKGPYRASDKLLIDYDGFANRANPHSGRITQSDMLNPSNYFCVPQAVWNYDEEVECIGKKFSMKYAPKYGYLRTYDYYTWDLNHPTQVELTIPDGSTNTHLVTYRKLITESED